MSAVFYPAIIIKDDDAYTVVFPDIPGCYSDGETVNEAAVNAEAALSLHLEAAHEGGIAIADPSQVDSPAREADEVARVLVRGERPGKIVRIQVTMDEGLLGRIDRVASNRSAFLAEASRAKLREMA